MDCNKRFGWDEYKNHTSCVSEAERYQGNLYVHKDNKGEVKQKSWLDQMQARLDSAEGSAKLKPFMERLLAYDNVPRKKAKFINFAKNSLNLKQDRDGIARAQRRVACERLQALGLDGGVACLLHRLGLGFLDQFARAEGARRIPSRFPLQLLLQSSDARLVVLTL